MLNGLLKKWKEQNPTEALVPFWSKMQKSFSNPFLDGRFNMLKEKLTPTHTLAWVALFSNVDTFKLETMPKCVKDIALLEAS